jgi:hypothetical protein
MATTYDKIATTTLGSATSSITFNSIAATYTDLRLVLVATGSVANYAKINFNSDTATNYSDTVIYGDGTTAYTQRDTSAATVFLDGGYTQMSTTIPAFYTVDIFSYAGSTFKTFLSTASIDKNGSGSVARVVGLWRSTSAITSIALAVNTGNFAAGSTATLYGILKA